MDQNAPPSAYQTRPNHAHALTEGFGAPRTVGDDCGRTVENTTEDTTYRGSVAVSLNAVNENQAGQIPYKTNYRKDFEIGPGGSARQDRQKHPAHLRFSVLCKEDWNEGTGTTPTFEISAGSQLKSRDVMLTNLDASGEDFIVVLTKDNSGSFRYLTNRKRGAASTMTTKAWTLAAKSKTQARWRLGAPPRICRRRWHDLTIANMIIVDGPPAEKLRPTRGWKR